MPETPIILDNVELVRRTDFGFWCRIEGRDIFVGEAVPQPGTTVCVKGDIGRLVLPRWFLRAQGLTEPAN